MELLEVAKVYGLLLKLFPGFLALWVFHAYTAHPERPTSERAIHALILTVLVGILKTGLMLLLDFPTIRGRGKGRVSYPCLSLEEIEACP